MCIRCIIQHAYVHTCIHAMQPYAKCYYCHPISPPLAYPFQKIPSIHTFPSLGNTGHTAHPTLIFKAFFHY